MSSTTTPKPFRIMDCSLAAIATGRRAQNLRELRDHIRDVDVDSIYYHFWGSRLRPRFDEPEFNNDFASWAHRGLHDDVTAERLSIIDPRDFQTLEELRHEIVEVIDARLDEQDFIPWSKTDQQFSFIRSQIVVLDTGVTIATVDELISSLPVMSTSSVYYHFIDARRRTETGRDDFSTWLADTGVRSSTLVDALAGVDPYFVTLADLRSHLVGVCTDWAQRGVFA
ncbi:MAG: DUF5752 family protein [Bacteroidia bacterium]|nr:DUF5752 family protein [Bacteroidia bacterium]